MNLRYFFDSMRYSQSVLRPRGRPNRNGEQRYRLEGRSETQARDAAYRALRLPFAALRDQVLPFLEPDVVELYDTEAAWEQMQTFVAEKLEEAQ